MIRQTIAVAALAATLAWAQEPAVTPAPGATPVSGQSYNGILMDASCSVISSASPVASYAAPGSTPSSTASTTTPTDTATAAGTAATPQNTTGVSQAGTTHSGAHPGTTDSLAQTRVTDRANQTQMPRTTAQAAERNDPATGIAGRGTGAETSATPAQGRSTNPAETAAGRITPDAPQSTIAASGTTPGAVAESSRARTEMVPSTVREKYKDCKVTSSTTAFAVYSNGSVSLLDDASNTMVKGKLASGANNAEWMSVNMQGSMEGNKLKVNSFDPSK